MAESGCLRDVHAQNLEVAGNADLSSSTLTHKMPIVTITADTTLKASQSGSIVYITDLDAAITLPTAEAGLNYTFVMGGVMNAATITCGTGDGFFGNITLTSTTDDKISNDEVVVAGGDVADSNVATLDGDAATSGGQAGDVLTCVAVNDTAWLLTGKLTTSDDTPASVNILG